MSTNDNENGSAPTPAGQPHNVVVIVTMRPDRIGGGLAEEESCGKPPAPKAVSKAYRTGSWFFASDLLERIADISRECPGCRLRPSQVEVTITLDEKAQRQVGRIFEAFDRAYRGL